MQTLDKARSDCNTTFRLAHDLFGKPRHTLPDHALQAKSREDTMTITRRDLALHLALPALALALISVSDVPAFAGADEDAIAKSLEAFRAAQAAGNPEVIASICAEELSYSHSNAHIDTKASLLEGKIGR